MSFQKRGFTSLLLTFSFFLATVSGVVLYVTPRGRTANAIDWSLLGLNKFQWSAIHINICLLVLIAAAVHLYLNWTLFGSYVKRAVTSGFQLKQEALLAVLFTALVTVGTYYDVPPFSIVTSTRYQARAYWEEKAVLQTSVPEPTPSQIAGDSP